MSDQPHDHWPVNCPDCGGPAKKPPIAKIIDFFSPGMSARLVEIAQSSPAGRQGMAYGTLASRMLKFALLLVFLFGTVVGVLLAWLVWRP